MENRELIASKTANEVRKDENLMRLYIEEYKGVFGYEPNCVPCTFSSDFYKFKNRVNNKSFNTFQMETQTFKLHPKFKNTILTYKIEKNPYRTYGYRISEDFAKKFLTHGTEEQIEERKKMFLKLPDGFDGKTTALKSSENKKTLKAIPVKPEEVVSNKNSNDNDDVSVELAKEYEELFGKRVYYPWGAKKVKQKIADKKAEDKKS